MQSKYTKGQSHTDCADFNSHTAHLLLCRSTVVCLNMLRLMLRHTKRQQCHPAVFWQTSILSYQRQCYCYEKGMLFFFFLVQTSRIIADEDRQQTLEFSREVAVMLAASHPRTLPSCSLLPTLMFPFISPLYLPFSPSSRASITYLFPLSSLLKAISCLDVFYFVSRQ